MLVGLYTDGVYWRWHNDGRIAVYTNLANSLQAYDVDTYEAVVINDFVYFLWSNESWAFEGWFFCEGGTVQFLSLVTRSLLCALIRPC